MDPENVQILFFMQDLFQESLSINFDITYKAHRERVGNKRKHITPNAFAAINDVVRCLLHKFNEHIMDIILTLSRCGKLDVYIALLGQFYLLESEFAWSKLRKFLGITCSVATFAYVKNRIYLTDELLNHIVSFLGCKLFGNPERFIGWHAFEQNCSDYISKNKHTIIVGDMKHLGDLEQELHSMPDKVKYTTAMSGILHSDRSDAGTSSQASSDPIDSCLQVRSGIRIERSMAHAPILEALLKVGKVGSGQSIVNEYEPVPGPSGAEGGYIPQQSINYPVFSGIANNISYNRTSPIVNEYEPVPGPSGAEGGYIPQQSINYPVFSAIADNISYNRTSRFLNNMYYDAEKVLTEQFIFSEVSELEDLLTFSLMTIDLIKNMQGPYHIRYN